MRNPFAVTIGEKISHLSTKAKVSLMELSCDISLKIKSWGKWRTEFDGKEI
jgi:hypothetical protein